MSASWLFQPLRLQDLLVHQYVQLDFFQPSVHPMNPRTPKFPWTVLRASPKLFFSTLCTVSPSSSVYLTVFLYHSTPTPFLHPLKAPLTKDCECNYMDSFVRMKGVTHRIAGTDLNLNIKLHHLPTQQPWKTPVT